MIDRQDIIGIADSIGKQLTETQIDEALSLYPSEADQDPDAEWYLVVEKIVYDITDPVNG